MAKFDVTPEMMDSIAKDLAQRIEEWNKAVSTIYSLYNEIDAEFDGEANERLKARMAADQPKYNALSELMVSYVNEIVKAASDYMTADNEAAAAIGQ